MNNSLDTSIEAITVVLRQILCSDDHDRNALPIRPTAQLVEELKPVHLWHHQIEDDHVGPRGGDRLDRNLAILGLGYLPSYRFQSCKIRISR